MTSARPITPQADQLDAQAAAFAQLLGLAPNELDTAYRKAVSLGEGLFPHQIEGVAFLLGRRRAILADDMGLGKTRQAIVSLRHAVPGGPYLVVCPASVKRNWAREIEQAIPGASVRVVEGTRQVPVELPGDDLLTHLAATSANSDRLTEGETIATCIQLLNAGHEATVHAFANGIAGLLQNGIDTDAVPHLGKYKRTVGPHSLRVSLHHAEIRANGSGKIGLVDHK